MTACPLARNRFFQPALFRRLIESESHEYRRPQLHTAVRTFMSPLGKLDFGDKFRTHELNFPQSADLSVKRILFVLQRLQAGKPAQIVYRRGKSGQIYVIVVRPLQKQAAGLGRGL